MTPDREKGRRATDPIPEASTTTADEDILSGLGIVTTAAPPGGLTSASPGQTERVMKIVGRRSAKPQIVHHDTAEAAGYAGWDYQRQGWQRPIPIPGPDDVHDGKNPPPAGYTGHAGLTPSGADIQAWTEDRAGDNTAIVMHDGIVGIDVDHYGDKRGGDTIATHEKLRGPLPVGPRSTSRPDNPISGIRFYRVPEGATFVTVLDGGGVEIIQPHHRYAVVWPSIHHEGRQYVWLDSAGNITDIPAVEDLPWLPDAWVTGMFCPPADFGADFGMVDVEDTFTAGEPDDRVTRELNDALDRLMPEHRSTRYDSTLRRTLALMRLGQNGHPGVAEALQQLGDAYVDAVKTNRHGGKVTAVNEYKRMLHSPSAKRALAVPSHQEAARKADEDFFAAMTREHDDMTTQIESDPGPGPDPVRESKLAGNGQKPDPCRGPNESETPGQTPDPKLETGTRVRGSDLYVDIAAQLAGGLPDPPKPTILKRRDGECLFYREQVNWLFGEPESGKTWVALGAVAETLILHGRALFIDLDHNGWAAIVDRLQMMGVPTEVLADQDRFCYCEPEDRPHLGKVIEDVKQWRPDVVVLDSIGELIPMFGRNSNSGDDFTLTHTNVLKPMAKAGAAVIAIDHLPKDPEAHGRGPIGAAAKKRTIGGVALRVKAMRPFVPGQGGHAILLVAKDRHGGVREHCPVPTQARPEQLAGTFVLKGANDTLTGELCWHVNPAKETDSDPDQAGVEEFLVKLIEQMDPAPTSIEDARRRLGVKKERAAKAYNEWKAKQDNTMSGTSAAIGITPVFSNNEK